MLRTVFALSPLDRVLRYQHRIVADVSNPGAITKGSRYRFLHGLYREHIYATAPPLEWVDHVSRLRW